jgi:hypothetical protein
MHVRHTLLRVGAGVEHQAITGFRDTGVERDLVSGGQQRVGEPSVGRRHLRGITVMLLGNDEHMRGCLRLDVSEGQRPFVVTDNRRRNLTSDNAAEQAIRSHASPS